MPAGAWTVPPGPAIEGVGGLTWLAAVGGLVLGLRKQWVTGSEAVMLLVTLTVVPLLGPMTAVLLVASRRRRTRTQSPAPS
jgi:uncharacterized membrane protein